MTWTHFRDERSKARTVRRCYLCDREIPADEVRVKRFGVNDGEFVRTDMHVECDAKTHGWDQTDWETFSPGDLVGE